VYNTPVDKLVWDVGHQGYSQDPDRQARAAEYHSTVSRIVGIPEERERIRYLWRGARHPLPSRGLWLVARDMRVTNHSVVAIIGDGGMTGGLAYEA